MQIKKIVLILFFVSFFSFFFLAEIKADCYSPPQAFPVGNCHDNVPGAGYGQSAGCNALGYSGWWCFNCGGGDGCYQGCSSGYNSSCDGCCARKCCSTEPPPPPRPCGDCIPEGCGFSAFLPEKKFASKIEINQLEKNSSIKEVFLTDAQKQEKELVVKMGNSEKNKIEANLIASVLEWAREIFRVIAKFLSNLFLNQKRFSLF